MKTITWEDKGCCLVFEGVDSKSPAARFKVIQPPYIDYDFAYPLSFEGLKERIAVVDNAIIKAMTLN